MGALSGSSFFFSRELLLNNYESPAHFVHHIGELNRQQRLLRVDDHVGVDARTASKPHRLPQTPLHPIPLHRPAERASHGKSNPHPRGCGRLDSRAGADLPLPVKHGHGCRKMPPPLLIHTLEIGVTQQPRAAGEAAAGSRSDISLRFSRHTGGHSDSKFPDRYFQVTCATLSVARWSGSQRIGAAFSPRHGTIRGNLVSPRPACAPWRDGGKLLSCRPGSSCACEIRVSSIACAGWVGMFAWAK